MSEALIWVTEVHNFGGFFGGDTVTLSAVPWPEGDETTWTIDQKALANVRDRHTIAPDMLLALDLAGERVDRAELRGARDLTALLDALGDQPIAPVLDGPQVRVYHCAACDLWIVGAPQIIDQIDVCAICCTSVA